ncbi:MAG: peptidase M28, partial [Pedobacter sp.]
MVKKYATTFLKYSSTAVTLLSLLQGSIANAQQVAPDSGAVKAINESSFAKHITVLASDDFKGRKPFTIGEQKSINYLKTEFSK